MVEAEEAVHVTGGANPVSGMKAPVNTLIARMQAGDDDAFETLMTRHEQRVVRTAWRILGNLEDGQDAAQEVFLRLHKYRHRLDASRPLEPWLYRLTINVCRDAARKWWRRATVSLETMGDAPLPAARTTGEEVALGELRDLMAQGLKKLSKKEREALVLRDLEGLSTAKVAEALGSSETTVRSQISKARVKMKKFRDRHIGRET